MNKTLIKDILDIQKEVAKDIINWKKDKNVRGATADPFDYYSKEYLWSKISPMLHKRDILAVFQDEHGLNNSNSDAIEKDNIIGGKYGKPLEISGKKLIFQVEGWRKLTLFKGDEKQDFYIYAVGDDSRSFNFATGKRATYGDRYLIIGVFGCLVDEKTAEQDHFPHKEQEQEQERGVENNNGEQQQTRDDEGISW